MGPGGLEGRDVHIRHLGRRLPNGANFGVLLEALQSQGFTRGCWRWGAPDSDGAGLPVGPSNHHDADKMALWWPECDDRETGMELRGAGDIGSLILVTGKQGPV